MSPSLLCRPIALLTVGVYSSNHRVLYTITPGHSNPSAAKWPGGERHPYLFSFFLCPFLFIDFVFMGGGQVRWALAT